MKKITVVYLCLWTILSFIFLSSMIGLTISLQNLENMEGSTYEHVTIFGMYLSVDFPYLYPIFLQVMPTGFSGYDDPKDWIGLANGMNAHIWLDFVSFFIITALFYIHISLNYFNKKIDVLSDRVSTVENKSDNFKENLLSEDKN